MKYNKIPKKRIERVNSFNKHHDISDTKLSFLSQKNKSRNSCQWLYNMSHIFMHVTQFSNHVSEVAA